MAFASRNSPFTLTLIPEQRPGRFTLTWDSTGYPIEFRSETDVTLGDLLRRLQPVMAGERDSSKKLTSSELLQALGTRLWQALLPETAPAEQRVALEDELRTGTTPLLLALPASLATLPWELLCDPLQRSDAGFLARRRPLVRLISGGQNLHPLSSPLRVLLLISSPPELDERQRVDIESERAAVESATREVREAGLLHLLVEDIVTPRRVQQALLRFKPHLLHYIGHGNYDGDAGGYLVWEDERGDPLLMLDTGLGDLLRSRGLRAVLLHSCQTANSDAHVQFHSVARALLDADIPAVLAQQANLTYESSQRASEVFYTSLTAGLGLAEATFEVRQALAQADRPDWAVPTLQATEGGLSPLLDPDASPGMPDPALASSAAIADLPAPTGVFVGRQHELRTLRAVLESTPDTGPVLVVITGPGGIGKSSLVSQAVARYGGRYKATITLSCAGYSGIDLFLHRIKEFLQRQGAPGDLEQTLRDPKLSTNTKIEAVIEVLNQVGPCLLIVDNLESSQREDRSLADPELLLLLQKMLMNLRSGRVLVTGRYTLEDILPGITFDPKLVQFNLPDLSSYEVHQLLKRHYALAQLGDAVRDELVREFGGLPYVYDLLSSKAATQNLTELIHDAQGRITRGSQQLAAVEWQDVQRQAIEFAAIEAISARLPEHAKALLARMSIFRRPFPREALEQGLGAIQTDWQSLLDTALLYYDSVRTEYRLHSVTARYAEKLLAPPDRKATQIQLAEWYFHLADEGSHDLVDYLEAHYFFRAASEFRRAAMLVHQLADPLRHAGLYHVFSELCQLSITDRSEQHDSLTASLQYELGIVMLLQGRYSDAKHSFDESLTLFQQQGNLQGRASALHELGIIAQKQGKYAEAKQRYDESKKIFEELGNPYGRASILISLGVLAQEHEQYTDAQQLYSEVLELYKQPSAVEREALIAQSQSQDDEADQLYWEEPLLSEQISGLRIRSIVEMNMGEITWRQGQLDKARQVFTEKLEIFKSLGDLQEQALALLQLGIIATKQEEYHAAWQFYKEGLAIYEQLGDLHGRAEIMLSLGHIAQIQKQLSDAQHLYNEALLLAKQADEPLECAIVMSSLGRIASLQKQYGDAYHHYSQSLALFEQLGERSNRADVLVALGLIAKEQKQYDEAQQRFDAALLLSEEGKDPRQCVRILILLGSVAQRQEHYQRARQQYGKALSLSKEIGDLYQQIEILYQFGEIAHDEELYEEARQWNEEILPILERINDLNGRAKTLGRLGIIAQQQGQYADARGWYAQALSLYETLKDQRGQALTLYQLGSVASLQSEYGEAYQLYSEALPLLKESGYSEITAATLEAIGDFAFEQEKYEEARKYFSEALPYFEQSDDLYKRVSLLRNLGIIAQFQNEYEEARKCYSEALSLLEGPSEQVEQALIIGLLGSIAQTQKHLGEAIQWYDRALSLWRQLGDLRGQAVTLLCMGDIAEELEQYNEVRIWYTESMALYQQSGDVRQCVTILQKLGTIAHRQGQYDEACRWCYQALPLLEQLGDLRQSAETFSLLAYSAQCQKNNDEAYRWYEEALPLFKRMDDLGRCVQILMHLGHISHEQMRYDVSCQWLDQALPLYQQLGDMRVQAEALFLLGYNEQCQEHYDLAIQWFDQALPLYQQLGDLRVQANILIILASLLQSQKKYGEAWQLHIKALPLLEECGDLHGQANTMYLLGMLAQEQEQYDEARYHYTKALPLFKQIEDLHMYAGVLRLLGDIAQQQGQNDEAWRWYDQALPFFKQLEELNECANALYNLGNIAMHQKKYEEVRKRYGEALPLFEQLNDPDRCAIMLFNLGKIAQEQGRQERDQGWYDEAQRLYKEALSLFKQQGDEHGLAKTLTNLGTAAQELGAFEEAQQFYSESLVIQRKLGYLDECAILQLNLGLVAQELKRYDDACRWYREASSLFEQVDDSLRHAKALYYLGLVTRQQGEHAEALGYIIQALFIFQDLHSPQLNSALQALIEIRSEIGDAEFMALWQKKSGGKPLPNPLVSKRREELLQDLTTFIQARSFAELQHIVETRTDLLSAETDKLLREIIAKQQDESIRHWIKRRQVLLARCREIGIAAAFAELQVDQTQYAEEEHFTDQLNTVCHQVVEVLRVGGKKRREKLAKQLDLMTDTELPLDGAHEFLALLAAWLRGDDVTERVETLNLEFQDAYHQMVDAVTNGGLSDNDEEQQDSLASQMGSMLDQFARVGWAERYQLLSEHADMLLAESIEAIFAALLEVNQESEARQFLEELRTLLRRCRTWGVDPAWHLALQMHLGDEITIPSEHETAIMQIATMLSQQQEDGGALVAAIGSMQELLNGQIDETAALFKAALLWDLAELMELLPAGHPLRNLKQMESCFREALPPYEAADRELSAALLQRSLGNVLTEQGRYAEALEPLQEAIRDLRTHEEYREETAWILSSYANALDNLGRTEEALADYDEAITLLPESAALYRNRAETLIHARRLKEAESDLVQAVALEGHENSPYLWYRRSQLAIARGKGRLSDQLLDEVVKREASFDVALQRTQAAWLQGRLEAVQETFQHVWEQANQGERAAIRRELERLFAEHSELDGQDIFRSIMGKGDE